MEVALHSKIKHQILGYYYGVWGKIFRGKDGPPYSLFYIDLFAGDGTCVCRQMPDDLTKHYPENCPREWKPPYFSLMKHAKENDFNLKCIFNDYDNEKKKDLKKCISEYENYIIEIESQDANEYYKRAIELIGKPNRPSIFYLDPSRHKDLKFSTIEGISKFKNETDGRRPELIINLMVFTMLMAKKRNNEEAFKTISESLGTDKWIDYLDSERYENKTHILFKDIFIEQLKKLGYHITYYSVESTVNNSPVYYLIFATFSDKIYSIHESIKPKVEELMTNEWVKRNYQVNQITSTLKDGQTALFEY